MTSASTLVYTDDANPTSTSGRRIVSYSGLAMGNKHVSTSNTDSKHREGSPRPAHPKKGRFSVRLKPSQFSGATYPTGYNPHGFIITAYLPDGKRLKLQGAPGQTVQQVIESSIPEFSTTSYQVFLYPSKALLNPEKDARVLQDQEISIEPMRCSSPEESGDERWSIARELLRTEDTFLEHLRNIFDIYIDPLKKWGISQVEMDTMFRALNKLCEVLMNFFSRLEVAVQQRWNTHTTKIGGLFKQYRTFWDVYKEYSASYTIACKLLKDKRSMDDSFNSFLEHKRGAAMHTLESLMLLPVQRIYEYHRLLLQLYKITPTDHCDYLDLRSTVNSVASLVQEREQLLVVTQNKANINRVQSRFPHDNLKLLDKEVSERRSKSMSHHPSTSSHISPKARKSEMIIESVDSGAAHTRLYLTEGPVRIISGMTHHDRFFFLFDDVLIIAKPIRKQKTQHKTYRSKEKLRLSEMWVTDCVDEVMECTLPPDTAFVIGWPTTNCLAAFSTPEEKILWYNQLSKHITNQRQIVQPGSVSVQVVNLTKSSNNIPVWLEVNSSETTRAVLLRAIELFGIAVSTSNCQLWVKHSKDDTPSPLVGHEHPFAIQMQHNRQQLDFSGDIKPTQLQFVIKRRSALASEPSVSRGGMKKQKFSFIRLVKKPSKRKPSVPKKRLFKCPLEKIIINNQLPEILQEMLIRLYTEAPQTMGIFRQSANYRKVKEIKEALDNDERVDLSNVSIHVIGALLKELLRSVPGGILMSTRYTEFVATNDVKDVTTRVAHLQRVTSKLPDEHQLFLQYLFPLLHHIAANEEVNCMNTINLAICFAPSLLWPDSGLDVIKNEVPPLVQFMIEHSPKIFGTELPELYKQVSLPTSPGVEKMEFGFENVVSNTSLVPTKLEDGSESSHKRTDSMDSSLSEDSTYAKNSLMRAHRTGLTLSDSQLSTISQHEYQPPQRVSLRVKREANHSATGQVGPVNKRVRKAREPKRSSSLQGPNDMSVSSKQYYERRQSEARRKSFALQNAQFSKSIPSRDSPAESHSSSSQDHHTSHPRHYPDRHTQAQYDPRHDVLHRQSPQKKRRVPQYSSSFSKGTETRPVRSMATSASWYDRLLPIEPDALTKSRSMGASVATRHEGALRLRVVGSGPISHEERVLDGHSRHLQLFSPHPSQTLSSNHSISSSRSGSSASGAQYGRPPSKPGTISVASNGSGSTQDVPIAKAEFKALSEVGDRFELKDSQDATTPKRSIIQKPVSTTSSYYAPIPEPDIDSFQPGEPRKRASSNASILSDSGFTKSSSYQNFISSQHKKESFLTPQQKKDSLMSLTQQAGLDDRPESDQHLNSLPRAHTAELVRPTEKYLPPISGTAQILQAGAVLETVTDHDPNKLYPSSGYNSDTESSPSRTLSRPGKIHEVTSPKTHIPSRYPGGIKYQPMSKMAGPPLSGFHGMSRSTTTPEATAVRVTSPQDKAPHVRANSMSDMPAVDSPKNSEGTKRPPRPKSGESGKIGQLVKTFSKPALEPNYEDTKVRLGLIAPRQRSKSTSEKEAMRIIHKIVEEDETAARTAEEEERAERHREWAKAAPTPEDRKKAWQSLSQDKFKRAELRSKSLKHAVVPPVVEVKTKLAMTPEMKRKSATMPDYLVTGPKRTLGTAQIRTYKVVTYNTPQPERVRHINLRTYH